MGTAAQVRKEPASETKARKGKLSKAEAAAATRAKILGAAIQVIRAQGYSATTVDDICAAAGVTKGSFFHHFASKEALGIAAIEAFGAFADGIFGAAPFASLTDPRERVLGYVDFRIAMLDGDIVDYSCLLGTTVQETYRTHPDLRAACDEGMSAHIDALTRDIEAAKQRYVPDAPWSAESVGYFMQAVLQGSFVYAKVKDSSAVAKANLAHLRTYLESLLTPHH
jgi:TetR/AcrR family transcriptional repressor of nem operon